MMAELKQKVKTYMVEYVCDECEVGTMSPEGVALLSMPAKYPHICDHCRAKKILDKKYPYMEYAFDND